MIHEVDSQHVSAGWLVCLVAQIGHTPNDGGFVLAQNIVNCPLLFGVKIAQGIIISCIDTPPWAYRIGRPDSCSLAEVTNLPGLANPYFTISAPEGIRMFSVLNVIKSELDISFRGLKLRRPKYLLCKSASFLSGAFTPFPVNSTKP